MVTRPTTVSSEKKTLDQDNFPEISVCLDPSLNTTAIHELGYDKLTPFYRGSMDGKTFVGWNGMGGDKNNREDIFNMKVDQQF